MVARRRASNFRNKEAVCLPKVVLPPNDLQVEGGPCHGVGMRCVVLLRVFTIRMSEGACSAAAGVNGQSALPPAGCALVRGGWVEQVSGGWWRGLQYACRTRVVLGSWCAANITFMDGTLRRGASAVPEAASAHGL